MPIGYIFWMLMIIWAIFGLAYTSTPATFGAWGGISNWVLLFVLLALLGWHSFGSVIHG